jgi:hypothetical protein
MPRLTCLATLTAPLATAPALAQPPPDAKAPPSDDYVGVDATKLGAAVVRPDFKWPQGTIAYAWQSPCGEEARKSPFCRVDVRLWVPRSRLDEVKALVGSMQPIRHRFPAPTKF